MVKISALIGVAAGLAACAGPVLAQDCGCGSGYLAQRGGYQGGDGLGRFQVDYGPEGTDDYGYARAEDRGPAVAPGCVARPGERVLSCRYVPFAPVYAPAPQAYEPAGRLEDNFDGGVGVVEGGGGGGGYVVVGAASRGFASASAYARASAYGSVSVQIEGGGRRRHGGGSGDPGGRGGRGGRHR